MGGLRRLRQQLERSKYNVHVCTAGLQLVSVVLRWLQPDAGMVLSPVVLNEVLELLAVMGGYRATAHELRTLFDLLQVAARQCGVLEPASQMHDSTNGLGSAPQADSVAGASASQLLRLLCRWCEPSAHDRSRDAGPRGPRCCFDLDGTAAGLSLPAELAVELVARGAFTIGGWVRLEDEHVGGDGTEGMLLFSMMGHAATIGVEAFLQPTHEQLALCVHGGSSSATSKLLRRGRPPPERCLLRGVTLVPGRWHMIMVSLRRAAPMRGRHEAIAFLDGRRIQTTPCPYPASLAEKGASAAAGSAGGIGTGGSGATSPRAASGVSFVVGKTSGAAEGSADGGASSGYPAAVATNAGVCGFTGQLGTLLLLKGVPTDAEALALAAAGTCCADPEAVCAAAGGGGSAMLIMTRSISILAAFDAATAGNGVCTAVHGAHGLRAQLGGGVSVLRPLDVRASLGGPLPLLPLVEVLGRAVHSTGRVAHEGLLSPVIHALTALLRGEQLYLVELERCDAIGMLAHLLAGVPAVMIDTDLLVAMCTLENALEAHLELSDQLLQLVFLRFSIWAGGGFDVVQPLLRQLVRMAGDRSQQWARTDALARLIDAMIDDFPADRAEARGTPATEAARGREAANDDLGATEGRAAAAERAVTEGALAEGAVAEGAVAEGALAEGAVAAPSAAARAHAVETPNRPQYTDGELHVLWDSTFDVLCSMADTPTGVPPSQLRYVLHATLRSGHHGLLAAAVRMLIARTYSRDLRVLESVLDGGNASLAFALFTYVHSHDSSVGATDLCALILKLVGRILALAKEDASGRALDAAVRWAAHAMWSKCGWAWLSLSLARTAVSTSLLEAVTEVLLGAVVEPRRRSHCSDAGSTDSSSASAMAEVLKQERFTPNAEGAAPFSAPQLLPLLFTLASRASPALQHAAMLNASLWLRHSHDASNHSLLTQQAGWQLPICSMLNDAGGCESDGATQALCIRLLAEHMISVIRQPTEASWAEAQLSISFIETHTVAPREVKRAVFTQVCELLRGKLPLPKSASIGAGAASATGAGSAAHASSGEAGNSLDAVMATWGCVLRLLILVEESVSVLHWSPHELHDQAMPAGGRVNAGKLLGSSLVRRLLTGGSSSRPTAHSASSTRHGTAATNPSASAAEDPVPSRGKPLTRPSAAPSFTIELQAEAAVARLLGHDGTASAPSVADARPSTPPVPVAVDDDDCSAPAPSGGEAAPPADLVPPAAGLPTLPPAAVTLSRDDAGVWMDASLVVCILQLVDPLIVQGIVDPLASYAMHTSAAALMAHAAACTSSTASSSVFSAVRSFGDRLTSAGGTSGDAGHVKCEDPADTLCDIIVRLQLMVLMECSGTDIVRPGAGFDPARQLQELLLCAACWCKKPLNVEDASSAVLAAYEPSRATIQQQLGHAMARLVQAWPVARAAREASDATAAAEGAPEAAAAAVADGDKVVAQPPKQQSTTLLVSLAPIVHGLLRMNATVEELQRYPVLHCQTPSAVESVMRFADEWQSWRAMLLREPYLGCLRDLEVADSMARAAAERWAHRQRTLVAHEDRTQRERRSLAERMQADTNSALRHLTSEVAPRAAISRSMCSRARDASCQQWAWTRHRLHEDHPIWGVASDSPPTTLRLCEWLDLHSRHMLAIADTCLEPPAPRTRQTSKSLVVAPGTTRSERNSSESKASAPTSELQSSSSASTREAPTLTEGMHTESTEHRLVGTGIRLPKLLTSIAHTFKVGNDAITHGADEEGGDEEDEEEEGEEEGEEDGLGLVRTDGDRPIFHTDAELVRPYGIVHGKLHISDRHLRFLGSGGAGDGNLDGDWANTRTRDSAITWPLASVKQMHRRRYLMEHSALELFNDTGDIALLNFKSKRLRSHVRRWLKRKCTLDYRDRDRHRAGFRQLLHELQDAWHRRELSNFEYLMRLNELAGRTHNDLNQYPVFPWVLADYKSDTLNLNDPSVFRDLARPMGAQIESQRELVAGMYEEFCDPNIRTRDAPHH